MDRHSPVVGVVDGVGANVGIPHRADHVKVERVTPQSEALPHVPQLDVLNPAGQGLGALRVQHDVSAVLVQLREWRVTLKDDVTREQPHVRSELDRVAAIQVLGLSEVREEQRTRQRDAVASRRDGNHDDRLGLLKRAVGGRRRDRQLRVRLPVDRLLQPDLALPLPRRLREVRPRAQHGLAVEVERAPSAAKHLGAICQGGHATTFVRKKLCSGAWAARLATKGASR